MRITEALPALKAEWIQFKRPTGIETDQDLFSAGAAILKPVHISANALETQFHVGDLQSSPAISWDPAKFLSSYIFTHLYNQLIVFIA